MFFDALSSSNNEIMKMIADVSCGIFRASSVTSGSDAPQILPNLVLRHVPETDKDDRRTRVRGTSPSFGRSFRHHPFISIHIQSTGPCIELLGDRSLYMR